MFYKNISYSVKTFYGVTFQPGETQEVADYINDKFMIVVDKSADKIAITPQKKPSSGTQKREPNKNVSTEVNDDNHDNSGSDTLTK